MVLVCIHVDGDLGDVPGLARGPPEVAGDDRDPEARVLVQVVVEAPVIPRVGVKDLVGQGDGFFVVGGQGEGVVV